MDKMNAIVPARNGIKLALLERSRFLRPRKEMTIIDINNIIQSTNSKRRIMLPQEMLFTVSCSTVLSIVLEFCATMKRLCFNMKFGLDSKLCETAFLFSEMHSVSSFGS